MTTSALPTHAPRAIRGAVFGLFLASGFCGLVYQVVWLRQLMLVFGVTAHAISTVLAAFMAGLALGSFVFGRYIDRNPRPLRAYAVLEIGIGVYALLVPALFWGAERVFGVLHGAVGDSVGTQNLVRSVLCFVVLLVPTTFMGATLPILSKFFIETLSRVGKETGRLYFINTFGAVLGTAVTGFFFIPTFGLQISTWIAAALNVGVGIVGWMLDRAPGAGGVSLPEPEAPEVAPPASPVEPARGDGSTAVVLAAFAVSGFAALVFEVIWARILILVFGSTVYSFSSMLTVFLLGLALGGAAFGWIGDRIRNPYRWLAAILGCISIVVLAEIAIINQLPYWFLDLLRGSGLDDYVAGSATATDGLSFGRLTFAKFVLSFIVLFPATILFGGTFPIVSKIYTRSLARTGRSIGTVYALNTLGAILGSIAGGFVFLPTLGMRGSLLIVATILMVSSCLMFVFGSGSPARRLVPAGVAALIFVVSVPLLPPWNRELMAMGVWFDPRQFLGEEGDIDLQRALREVNNLYYAEGLNDTIIVNESPSERSLSVNGKIVASSNWEDTLILKMLGHLPYLVHPGSPKLSLNVGLGIGGTISGLAAQEIETVHVAELERAVPPAARLFAEWNDAVVDNPKLEILIGDGRQHLIHTDLKYDIISSDPFHPFMTGAGNLYSREYFELGKSRLADDGIMTLWIPLYHLADGEFRSLIKTFGEVFPYYSVWFSGRSVITVGSVQPLRLDPDLLRARMEEPGAREWLGNLGLDTPERLLSFLIGDQDSMRQYAPDVPSNTDRHPWVEYAAAKRLYDVTDGVNMQGLYDHRIEIDAALAYFDADAFERGDVDLETARAYLEARFLGMQSVIEFYDGAFNESVENLVRSVRVNPDPFLLDWLSFSHERVGLLAQQNGQTEAARSHFEACLAIRPDRVAALGNLGYLYYFEGRLDEALVLLRRARELQPSNTEFMLRLALVHGARGETSYADDLFRTAIERAPRSPDPRSLYAVHLLSLGRHRDAERWFRESLALDPDNPSVRVGLAEALAASGALEAAREILAETIASTPQHAAAHHLEAKILLSTGNYGDASRAAENAVRLEAGNPDIQFTLARCRAAGGDRLGAAEALTAALRLGGPRYGALAASDPTLASLVEESPEDPSSAE